jgi:uncharacterized membrane protein YjgN (DUF898 family)
MRALISIICPSCAYTRDISPEKIAPGANQATCPRCRHSFPLPLAAPTLAALGTTPPATPLPPQPATSAPGGKPQPRLLRFTFNGTARDYFGIWIVNTLLKILTVGFYSAWAKVRKRRFFYGSTTLGGEPFDYLADPMALFRGWLIAAAAFVLYMVGSKVSPLLSMVTGGIIFAVFPWLVVRSRMFNATNSAHRNIRFSFRPDYRQSYLVFMGLPLLTMLTLGLLSPYMLYRQKKFMVENSSFGATRFSFGSSAKEFYLFFLKAGLAFGAIVALLAGMAALMNGGVASAGEIAAAAGKPSPLIIIPLVIFFLVYFALIVYVQTALANLTWNATSLGGNRFRSSLRARDMAWLYFSSAVAVAASLGLLMPWATVRIVRYRFDRLEIVSDGSLDRIVAGDGDSGISATGEEIGDVFDFPVDLAL